MIISIVIFLFALAGYFNYIMDYLDFRGELILFTKGEYDYAIHKNPNGKWKNGNKSEGERFLFSSTVLVFLTDGWHLSKWLMFSCFEIAVSILLIDHYDLSFWWIPAFWMGLKAVRGGVFSIFFR